MTEEWRPVEGYAATYEVSEYGRVRRLDGYVRSPQGTTGFRRAPAHILRPSLVHGYPVVRLCQDGIPKMFYTYTLVARAFIGPRPLKHDINHKDGNKENAHVSNLEYLTEAQNNQHAYDVLNKGATIPRGEQHPHAKLTEADVKTIRTLRANGALLRELAARFGVHTITIFDAISGRNWKHI